jgi:four helix bundle protein
MNNQALLLPHQRTDIYRAAMQLCVIVQRSRIRDAELRDQAERAAKSCFLAISEGLPQRGARMRQQYFDRARSSAWECAGAIHLACEIGAMDESSWQEAHVLSARTSAMLVALLRGCR